MNIHLTLKGKPRKRMTFQWTEENIAIASLMWNQGFTSTEIGIRLGVSRSSVTAMAYKHRDQFPTRMSTPKKSLKPPKITPEWLTTASEMWKAGHNVYGIARATGLHAATARDRIARRPEIFPDQAGEDAPAFRSIRSETHLGDDIVIYHAKRMHITGEVHTMPRVSIINGKEA